MLEFFNELVVLVGSKKLEEHENGRLGRGEEKFGVDAISYLTNCLDFLILQLYASAGYQTRPVYF